MSKMTLRKYDNEGYRPGNVFKLALWYFFSLVFLRTAFPWPSGVKRGCLRMFGAQIGERVVIKPSVLIKYPWFLKIGDDTWIGEKVWIDNLAEVTIAHDACLSQGAMLLTGNHNYTKSSFNLITGPIHLEEGVWIGARSVVCPGVTCRSHSILTVGSVAQQDLIPFGIYSGNPAQKIRMRTIQ